MPKGRHAKPTALKELTGRRKGYTAGGRKIEKALQPNGDGPVKPGGLTPLAEEIWDETVEAWASTSLLTSVDSQQLGVYCELQARFWEYRERGKVLPVNEIVQLRAYSGMFGMDPASRAKIATAPKEDEDEDPIGKLRKRNSSERHSA